MWPPNIKSGLSLDWMMLTEGRLTSKHQNMLTGECLNKAIKSQTTYYDTDPYHLNATSLAGWKHIAIQHMHTPFVRTSKQPKATHLFCFPTTNRSVDVGINCCSGETECTNELQSCKFISCWWRKTIWFKTGLMQWTINKQQWLHMDDANFKTEQILQTTMNWTWNYHGWSHTSNAVHFFLLPWNNLHLGFRQRFLAMYVFSLHMLHLLKPPRQPSQLPLYLPSPSPLLELLDVPLFAPSATTSGTAGGNGGAGGIAFCSGGDERSEPGPCATSGSGGAGKAALAPEINKTNQLLQTCELLSESVLA